MAFYFVMPKRNIADLGEKYVPYIYAWKKNNEMFQAWRTYMSWKTIDTNGLTVM
jgi:hypothetical protein